MAKLIYELLPELRKKRDLTVPELSRITIRNGGTEVPQKSIEALESKSRAGQIPKAHTLVALAKALDVPPDRFYEWPIAEAQAARTTRSPVEIARGAAQRRRDTPAASPRDQSGKPKRGRAA